MLFVNLLHDTGNSVVGEPSRFPERAASPKTILVVEDEVFIRMATAETLIIAGFCVKRRVAELESEAKGEHQLSRRQFEQIREIRDDMAVLRSHAATLGEHVARLETRIDRLDGRVARVETQLTAFRQEFAKHRQELPALIANTMREVLREQSGRKG
jgi:predicted RNase H-like nuclease (RuvC/YqgF family)